MDLPRYHAMEDYNPKEVLTYLKSLGHLQAGGCTEIRILPEEVRLRIKNKLEYVGKVVSGYYTNYEKAVQDKMQQDRQDRVQTALVRDENERVLQEIVKNPGLTLLIWEYFGIPI